MTIEKRIEQYLNAYFDDERVMLEIDNEFKVYKNAMEALPALIDRFIWWSIDNEDEQFNNNPVLLFEYCLNTHDFGDICTLYYQDSSGDFRLEKPINDVY